MSPLAPKIEAELAEIIADSHAHETPLRLVGAGTKGALGRPSEGKPLTLAAFSGVTLYEPEELVISAGAGTPRAEIEALLDAHGQQLAFEPIDFCPLLGGAPGQGTVGAMTAIGASGPRRLKAGGLRDHLLGFRCVTGRGEIVKSGGRVMKNVTGYDLSKLVAGSYGTLAALTEVTFKVLPKAETEATLVFETQDEAAALAALRTAAKTPNETSGLAALPKGAAPLGLARDAALMRLEGPAISVAKRLEDIRAALGGGETLSAPESAALWRDLRDAAPIASAQGLVWRVSVAPTDGFALVDALRHAEAPLLAHFYDWAGGLVWLRVARGPDAHAALIRSAVARLGGHSTLICAGAETRASVEVFQPQPPALAALTRRVKESFDPRHIMERGRMRAEF
ncbi:MAG TPA: glycolate oxidase subunit GlcE [Methylocystis sp.]|nr:glycolate oxidase subunit GlcE [Methylocystis sp.]